jgi:diguanylate cyclase (GGDEF)-like protein
VVAGSIRFTYFHELFNRLNLSEGDTICVLRGDRTIIIRTPFDFDVIGKKLDDTPRGKRSTLPEGSSYSGVGPVDDIPRLYVRRASSNPLVVVVGKPLDDIMGMWRTQALRIGAIMVVLIAFVLAVTLFLAREICRRAEAEGKLEELATTDALTGLRNRRKFDAAIEAEWRRAMRHKTSLSLLMIDADHFKSYNDTYGHQAGDQVLVGIAICISDSVKRAGDCAARYGGEEFAVLLPGQSAKEAVRIAETIRTKVQGWVDDATLSTVSIGIAGLTPSAGMDWHQFVAAADKALYAAKAAGRNRCVLAQGPGLSLAA